MRVLRSLTTAIDDGPDGLLMANSADTGSEEIVAFGIFDDSVKSVLRRLKEQIRIATRAMSERSGYTHHALFTQLGIGIDAGRRWFIRLTKNSHESYRKKFCVYGLQDKMTLVLSVRLHLGSALIPLRRCSVCRPCERR